MVPQPPQVYRGTCSGSGRIFEHFGHLTSRTFVHSLFVMFLPSVSGEQVQQTSVSFTNPNSSTSYRKDDDCLTHQRCHYCPAEEADDKHESQISTMSYNLRQREDFLTI